MTHTYRTMGLVTLTALAIGGLSLSAQQPGNRAPADLRMSGTYDLESTRGGNPQQAAAAATRSLLPNQRERAYQDLLTRLDPPQRLSIDRAGRMITIASNRGPRTAFDADGQLRTERNTDGRMVTTRAELYRDELRVSVLSGRRGSDFSVTFESLNNGANLRVTRRLDDEDFVQPVVFQSYYRRLEREPRWDVYDNNGPGYGRGEGYARGRGTDGRGTDGRGAGGMWTGSNANYEAVPDGTRLVATLDTPLSMRTSRSGEPFTMTVRGPGEYQGARIDGVVQRVSAPRGSDMDLRVDFQRIDLRGRSSDFDAVLNTVRMPDGTILRINAEGEVRQNSNNETVRNGAVGVALGAIIGALAGGGKGAAIGGIVGGAGGVIVSQGHESLDLPRGAEVTLTAISR